MIARDGMQRPTEERLQALRDYYTGNVDGAGDVEDLFREIDALTAQIEELERKRDSLVKQSLAQGAWMEGAMPNFSEVAEANARAEAAEQRVKELESALRELDVRSMSDYDAAITRAALAQSDPPEDSK